MANGPFQKKIRITLNGEKVSIFEKIPSWKREQNKAMRNYYFKKFDYCLGDSRNVFKIIIDLQGKNERSDQIPMLEAKNSTINFKPIWVLSGWLEESFFKIIFFSLGKKFLLIFRAKMKGQIKYLCWKQNSDN